jgi:hypothetical protein
VFFPSAFNLKDWKGTTICHKLPFFAV